MSKAPIVIAGVLALSMGLLWIAQRTGIVRWRESISYKTSACDLDCPIYTVTVRGDGSGLFEGRRYTAVEGRRRFRVTPDQYRIFANQLAPLRPRSGAVRYDGPPLCADMVTDAASVDVKWQMQDGSQRELYFYYGCGTGGRRAMAERLAKAPDLLPIAAFIHAQH